MATIPKSITDPKEIEKYLIEKAKQDAKQIAEERAKDDYLKSLPALVSKETGKNIKTVDSLIKVLVPFASPRTKALFGEVATTKNSTSKSAKKTAGKRGKRKRARITPEIIAQIKKLAKDKLSKAEIARQTGVSYPSVYNILNKK